MAIILTARFVPELWKIWLKTGSDLVKRQVLGSFTVGGILSWRKMKGEIQDMEIIPYPVMCRYDKRNKQKSCRDHQHRQ